MRTRDWLALAIGSVVFLIGAVVGCQTHAHFNPVDAVPLIGKSDTVTVRDTLRVPVPYPVLTQDAGTVTVRPLTHSDSVKIAANVKAGVTPTKKTDTPILKPSGDLDIPISRKTYSTAEFKAVVSGWRPSLDSMTVYPKTQVITNTVEVRKKSHLSITIGPTALYDGTKVTGGIGVTAGFTILAR